MGIRSAFKKATKKIKKLIPKEAAGIMQMAAPFVAPHSMLGAAALSGLGQLRGRGKINPLMLALSTAPGWTGRFNVRNQLQQRAPWLDKRLFGSPELSALETQTPWGVTSMTPPIDATQGLLGFGGEYLPLQSQLAETAIGGKKFEAAEGITGLSAISPLKAVSWGSSIIGGIQAGKFKEAQEAADAAAAAAQADGITDSEWIEAARAEAAEYWDKWRAETTFAQGGRVGYNIGQLVRPAPGRPGYKGEDETMEDLYTEIFTKFMQKFPNIDTSEMTLKDMIAMLQAEGIMGTEGLGILGLDKSMSMITPESVDKDIRRLSRDDTQYGKIPEDIITGPQRKQSRQIIPHVRDDIPMAAQGGRVGYQLGVGPVGGIGAMQPQLPMQPPMQPQMQTPMTPQAMQTPPQRESGLGRLPIEADMRYTGGFMPYGKEEKADDVPARLSKNEFVFTADAVKAAGGGSVNQGAKKLYDTMKQLEAKV